MPNNGCLMTIYISTKGTMGRWFLALGCVILAQ
jgi:hypothetical protein